MLKLPPLPDTIRTLTDEEADRLDTHEIDHYPPKNCRICKGTKTFRWWADEKHESVADWECNCVEQWILYRYLRHSGVGFRFMTLGWADLTYADYVKVSRVKQYCKDDSMLRAGIGLYLYGDMGTGKTTLSSLVARKFIADGVDCYMTGFTSLLDGFTSTWKDLDERKWFYRRVKNAQVLFIDDIGREGNKASFTTTAMDDVLRHRVAAGLVTCLTTNLDPDEFIGKYSNNVYDLLCESASPEEFRVTPETERNRTQTKRKRNFEKDNNLTRPMVLG